MIVKSIIKTRKLVKDSEKNLTFFKEKESPINFKLGLLEDVELGGLGPLIYPFLDRSTAGFHMHESGLRQHI